MAFHGLEMLLNSNLYTESDEKIMAKPVEAELIFKYENNCHTVKEVVPFVSLTSILTARVTAVEGEVFQK